MRNSFNSDDEALGFYHYIFARQNSKHLNSVAFNIGSSAEHLLKEIYYQTTGKKFEEELYKLIDWFKREVNKPDTFDGKAREIVPFLQRLRFDRNLVHKDVFILDARYMVSVLEEFQAFIEWYSRNYDIENWEDTWELEKHKYASLINARPAGIKNLQVIGHDYFDRELQTEAERENSTLDYYLKFNNTWSYLRRIVANNIHIPPPETFTIRVQGEEENRENVRFQDMVSMATASQALLIKINAVGGVGKSTLLWHTIKQLHKKFSCFYLERADPAAIEYIFEQLIDKSTQPVLMFLDDVVSSDENIRGIVALGEAIAEKSSRAPVVLIAAERYYRYNKFKDRKDFERNFSVVANMAYSNRSIRNEIFEKIYDSLGIAKENPSDRFKADCYKVFTQYDFESLIDSTYYLIKHLRKNTEAIHFNYKFDWEDWSATCSANPQKYGILEDLFKVVAFFYRYGIRVPFDYLKEYYQGVPRINDLARDMIGKYDDDFSPIVRDVDGDKVFLKLRHEKMGEWFFQTITDGKEVEKEFFLDFINNIQAPASCYLFRNLHRNAEFQISPLHQYLSNTKRLQIIDSYLARYKNQPYDEEVYKTLMEKHFTLMFMGENEKALEPLEETLLHDPKNYFASSRLATCIEQDNPERAETLYLQSLMLTNRSKMIALRLFRLYHIHPSLKKFDEYQQKVFEVAYTDNSFSFYLINFLSTFFPKLPASTLSLLLSLHPEHLVIRIAIAELMIEKRRLPEAFLVLKEAAALPSKDDMKTRNKITGLLIDLHDKQTVENHESLNFARELNQKNHLENPTDPLTTFFYGKIQSMTPGKYKMAEFYFGKAYELDRHNIQIFFEISRFYRSTAGSLKEKGKVIRAIHYLLKGVTFIRKQLKSDFRLFTYHYRLELGLALNDLANAYQEHAMYIYDVHQKYPQKINAAEAECEKYIQDCLKELGAKFIGPGGELFHSPLTEPFRQLYSKGCTILSKAYLAHAFRVLKSAGENEHGVQKAEAVRYFTKAKTVLEKALIADEDNPNTFINLIETNFALEGDQYKPDLDGVNFSEFNATHKIRLCKLLIRHKLLQPAHKLLNKFSILNSTQPLVKADLAYCYAMVKEWGKAARILLEIKTPPPKTINLTGYVAREMPVVDPERAEQKIALCRRFITLCPQEKSNYDLIICGSLFKSCQLNESWDFFLKNIWRESGAEPHIVFYNLYRNWIHDLADFCTKQNAISENMIYRSKKYMGGIAVVTMILDNLLKINYHFKDVQYVLITKNILDEKLKAIIGRAQKALLHIVELKNRFSFQAKAVLVEMAYNHKNPLYDKIFLRKILSIKNEKPIINDRKLISHFEMLYPEDRDILGMIGRFFLKNFDFQRSAHFFERAQQNDRNETERCYSLSNHADWIITKIETQGKISFKANQIPVKLEEAQRLLEEGLKLYPAFKFADDLNERLIKLIVLFGKAD